MYICTFTCTCTYVHLYVHVPLQYLSERGGLRVVGDVGDKAKSRCSRLLCRTEWLLGSLETVSWLGVEWIMVSLREGEGWEERIKN